MEIVLTRLTKKEEMTARSALNMEAHLYSLEEISKMYKEVALMAARRAGNLAAKHPPKRCDVCGRTFVPYSGRALYCRTCRTKGYKWIKEQRKRSQS